MKITFSKCPCGAYACDKYFINEMGSFVMGTGFTRSEAVMIRRAFETQEAVEQIRRLLMEDEV